MDRFAARRKILRGSLSAPLVLTVASPAAAALARQSFEACLARAEKADTEPTVFIGETAHDTWLRKNVKIYIGVLTAGRVKQKTNQETGSYFYVLPGQPNEYYAVEACGGPYPPFSNGNGPDFVENKLALVFVDASGHIVGVGACPKGGFPVTTSCWASFGGMMQL